MVFSGTIFTCIKRRVMLFTELRSVVFPQGHVKCEKHTIICLSFDFFTEKMEWPWFLIPPEKLCWYPLEDTGNLK